MGVMRWWKMQQKCGRECMVQGQLFAAERGVCRARLSRRSKLDIDVSWRQHRRLKLDSYQHLYSQLPHNNPKTMAAIRVPSAAFWETFLPIARAQLLPPSTQPITKRIPLLQRLRATTTLLPATLTPIPSLLSDLWDGLLNAVPKKKTSHMKKRHRQMAAGKHLKDVTALNKCSACGRAKRAHVLCPYCVQSESTTQTYLSRRLMQQRRLLSKQ